MNHLGHYCNVAGSGKNDKEQHFFIKYPAVEEKCTLKLNYLDVYIKHSQELSQENTQSGFSSDIFSARLLCLFSIIW